MLWYIIYSFFSPFPVFKCLYKILLISGHICLCGKVVVCLFQLISLRGSTLCCQALIFPHSVDCMVSSSISFANLLLIFSGVGVSRFPSVSLLLLCRCSSLCLQLQSTNATYVFVNPHHLEAELLKEMWQNQEPHHPALQIMPDNYVPIADLLQLQTTEIKGRTFNIKAEIIEIETTKGWSYTACPICNQSVLQVNT
ncbi:putative nucleic acid-binding protein [Helianthus annuus]|nr:putative nucleic acid-binding protein [Helianthus annuus]